MKEEKPKTKRVVKKKEEVKEEPKTKRVVKKKEEVKKETTKTKKVVEENKKETKKTRVVKSKKEVNEKKESPVETKKEKGLLEKKEQKTLKVLSRIVNIVAKISRIFLMIALPFIFLVMVILPLLFRNYEVDGNIIKFDDIRIVHNEDKFVVKVADNIYLSEGNIEEFNRLFDFLSDNDKTKIIICFELLISLAVASIIVLIYVLSYIEKIFYNIYSKKIPFTDENSNYILKICHLMIALVIISFVSGFVSSIFVIGNISSVHYSISLGDLVIAYIIYYIYKYAVQIQKKTDSTIYD